jgi:hypothetical protein
MSDAWRERVAVILEIIARDGLPNPRDLDVALDAIACEVADLIEATRREEREACAKVCDERGEAETQTLNDGNQHYRPHADRREAQRCAVAIRARGDA